MIFDRECQVNKEVETQPWGGLSGRLSGAGHVLAVRVYFEDTDFSGLVYHTSYLRWCERGRSDYLRLLGVRHEQLVAGAALLQAWPHADPHQVAVLPGRILFFNRGAEGKADDLSVEFRDQAKVAVGVEQGCDLVLIPGSVHARREIGREEPLPQVKDRRQIIDGQIAYFELFRSISLDHNSPVRKIVVLNTVL